MAQTLYALPESFAAGTTVNYTKTLSDYPSDDGWTLTLYLAGAKTLSQESTAGDGGTHVIELSATDTAALTAGVYKYAERVSNEDGEVYQIASGVVTVTADIAEAGDGDEQEWLERAISVLRAHLEGRLAAGLESYQIAGRVVAKMPVKEALEVLTSLEARLARVANPDAISRSVLIHFSETGFDQ